MMTMRTSCSAEGEPLSDLRSNPRERTLLRVQNRPLLGYDCQEDLAGCRIELRT